MKKRINLLMLALCGSIFATLASPVLSAQPESDMIGRQIPDFLLPDAAGKKVALSDFNDSKTLVVKEVRWGDQSWEEVMIGFFSTVDPLPPADGAKAK